MNGVQESGRQEYVALFRVEGDPAAVERWRQDGAWADGIARRLLVEGEVRSVELVELPAGITPVVLLERPAPDAPSRWEGMGFALAGGAAMALMLGIGFVLGALGG